MIQCSRIHFVMASSTVISLSLLLGCDAEQFIPNDEAMPVEILRSGVDAIKVTYRRGLSASNELTLPAALRTSFIAIMGAAHRNANPVGISEFADFEVFDASTLRQRAHFRFCLDSPRISNDGREYDVSSVGKAYFEFLADVDRELNAKDSNANVETDR